MEKHLWLLVASVVLFAACTERGRGKQPESMNNENILDSALSPTGDSSSPDGSKLSDASRIPDAANAKDASHIPDATTAPDASSVPDATVPDAAKVPDASVGDYGVCGTSCDPYNNDGCAPGQYCAAWNGLTTDHEPEAKQPKTRCYPAEGTAGPWHIDSCTNGPTDDASQRCPTGYVCSSLGCFRNCRTSFDCGPGTGPDNYIRCDFTSFGGELNCLPHCARREG